MLSAEILLPGFPDALALKRATAVTEQLKPQLLNKV